MRKILFRGKRLDNGEWVEGGYYREDYTDYVYITFWNSFGLGFMDSCQVDPATVGQYTGLTDNDGKRIFEGDVIKGLFLFGLEVLSVVDFEGGSFGQKWNRGDVAEFSPFTSICNVSFEVIGNIHDNPELIKEEPPVAVAENATTTATHSETERVRCADCKHLMYSDCYGECGAGHRGIVRPDDTCPHGDRRGDDGTAQA